MANPFLLGAAQMTYCYFIRSRRATAQFSTAWIKTTALAHNQSSQELILVEKSILTIITYQRTIYFGHVEKSVTIVTSAAMLR